jgi:RHH-type transcriptional regulator, proline utilization regulon repressor / proline dehydrogenase / delta 1-pyrroline-5-carboxylate dehydrogenase
MQTTASSLPEFTAPFAEPDAVVRDRLLAARGPLEHGTADALARGLIGAVRAEPAGVADVEELLREYSLTSKEGLALMVLAEALLRVPDAATADRLIEDTLGHGEFARHVVRSQDLPVNASAWALGIGARIVHASETPQSVLQELVKRIGQPVVRAATRQAMRALGSHFILGQTIEEALQRAQTGSARLYRYSFDMLGEGARTAEAARRYFESYAHAIAAIGKAAGNRPFPDRAGISVKLSALHPRYEPLQRDRVLRELSPRVLELARQARAFDLNFTIDAEEADRLELSLEVIGKVLADSSLAGWDGFGFAVQAYQKRAPAVLGWAAELAKRLDRRIAIRLVKGAYWDTEIKRAQERGVDGFPVFTRKAMTDLSYEVCAMRLLALRSRLFPQFATHNALTVASIIDSAGAPEGYEFQRLHGMGEALYRRLIEMHPRAACRTYAPVGTHRDLLAYLVRRLLENGANSSFVSAARDPSVPVERLLLRPSEVLQAAETASNPRFPNPRGLFGAGRRNSRGVEFGCVLNLQELLDEVHAAARADVRTRVPEASEAAATEAMRAAAAGFAVWSRTSVQVRAEALERAADLFEGHRGRLIHLLQLEAGKTLVDALSEVREGVDFCRYYAAEGRRIFGEPVLLPGPAGESNALELRGRGVFVAISPWNFPLSIFVGQVAAALMAGNAVMAKPAEQTPLIATEAVRLLHQAGVPATVLHLVLGDGDLGAALVAHADVAGVVFTGSTQVAREINRGLAAKDGPIVPLIAETGGINAMIVDATALPEHVADDVLSSAFRSAGQRCSALRLLCVQADVAEHMLEMIVGAARELKVGDPRDLATDVGPIIDAEAKQRLDRHIAKMKKDARRVWYVGEAPSGLYVAPHIFELDKPEDLREELFGPVLHVVRYAEAKLGRTVQSIAASGYGLTLGIHSRIQSVVDGIIEQLPVGNVYVNRNMIGAVVGVQPFGGHGLSGTGPKAGGPHYLPRFATEQTVTINTAAAGGNARLFSEE